jgi:hypothetical protein
MRPFRTDQQRLREYVESVGKPGGKALLLLKLCEENLEALSLIAGDPALEEVHVMSRDGKRKAKTDDGEFIMETVPVLDRNGQPVFEAGEMSPTELTLYQICSTLVQVLHADHDFSKK